MRAVNLTRALCWTTPEISGLGAEAETAVYTGHYCSNRESLAKRQVNTICR